VNIVVWKQVDIDTQPTEYVSAVLCHSLSVADEVVVDAARLTNLVHRFPMLVERLVVVGQVDDVLNEFPKCHWTDVSCVFAVLTFDVPCKGVKTVSANNVHLFLYTSARVIITKGYVPSLSRRQPASYCFGYLF